MAIEGTEIEDALEVRLKSDTALVALLGGPRIQNIDSPNELSHPKVVFWLSSKLTGTYTPIQDQTIQIDSFGRNAREASKLSWRVFKVLHDKALTIAGMANFVLLHQNGFSQPEQEPNGPVHKIDIFVGKFLEL